MSIQLMRGMSEICSSFFKTQVLKVDICTVFNAAGVLHYSCQAKLIYFLIFDTTKSNMGEILHCMPHAHEAIVRLN